MLDDLKIIAQRDPGDVLGVAGKQLDQLNWEFDVGEIKPEAPIQNVVLGGMGGSALYAEIYRAWPSPSLPFEIVRGYRLPQYVSKNTLYIASSFSGNTEEALEGLEQAEKIGCTIVVAAAGGKLAEIAREKGYPFAEIDGTIPQPRMSALNAVKGLLTILEAAGVEEGLVEQLMAAGKAVDGVQATFAADVPTDKNLAKQLALELVGKSLVAYSGRAAWPVANKFKINTNENAKNVAWSNFFPEQNHNEFIGWSSHPVEKPYAILNVLSSFEHPRIAKRFEAQNKLLSGMRPHPTDVELQGDTHIEQIIYGIILADFTSIYLAILNNVDPEPVALVEELKVELTR